ncbi:hypothetical protein BJF85_21475 [Saccharomonospora sp. CUA-673]|nr:hypothetical protein BJF85_21475 [Saccharomonospora sp. CUA-673]
MAATGAATALVLTAVLPAAAQAQEQEQPAAFGSVGLVDVVHEGNEVRVGPIADCDVDEQPENSTPGVDVGGGDLARYGSGETTCERADGRASTTATGERFSTSILEEYGGPEIRVRSFTAQCQTTENGSSSSMQLSGVSGFDLPQEIPPNHEILIPGDDADAAPLAKVVLNEFTAPDPPDGSLEMSAVRIQLFPEGGPVTGDIRLGMAACDPYGA